MPIVSAAFDFALGVACLWFARGSVRLGNDFLFTGFLWVALAAVVGSLNLGGLTEVDPTHVFLSRVSRGPGTLAMGLGVFAAIYGGIPGQRWAAPALAIFGAAAVHLLASWSKFDLISLLLGSTLLIGLLVLMYQAFRMHHIRPAITALAAFLMLMIVGFAMPLITLPADGLIRRVDVLHILLILCYTFLWISVRDMTQRSRP